MANFPSFSVKFFYTIFSFPVTAAGFEPSIAVLPVQYSNTELLPLACIKLLHRLSSFLQNSEAAQWGNSSCIPGPNVIKHFTDVIYKFFVISLMLVPGKPFQPSLTFPSKAGHYPSEVPFKCSILKKAPCLTPANIRLGWKGLRGTNTIVY